MCSILEIFKHIHNYVKKQFSSVNKNMFRMLLYNQILKSMHMHLFWPYFYNLLLTQVTVAPDSPSTMGTLFLPKTEITNTNVLCRAMVVGGITIVFTSVLTENMSCQDQLVDMMGFNITNSHNQDLSKPQQWCLDVLCKVKAKHFLKSLPLKCVAAFWSTVKLLIYWKIKSW